MPVTTRTGIIAGVARMVFVRGFRRLFAAQAARLVVGIALGVRIDPNATRCHPRRAVRQWNQDRGRLIMTRSTGLDHGACTSLGDAYVTCLRPLQGGAWHWCARTGHRSKEYSRCKFARHCRGQVMVWLFRFSLLPVVAWPRRNPSVS